MENEIKFLHRETKAEAAVSARFGPETAQRARRFHSGLPGYAPTPLVELPALAETLGVAAVFVKDESRRFGLNAFKALGGSYCIGGYLADLLGVGLDEHTFEKLTAPAAKQRLGRITFATATDGNHGRGIAWTAHILGQQAVVFMPKGSAPERLENIRALGAEASITDLNYDGTVAYAAGLAEKNGWVLVQDTSWPGYETIPGRIMEGYTTMADETREQLGGAVPTHVFLQAGVGAMSGALAEYFAACYGAARPTVTVVEPNAADCIFRTASAGGTPQTVGGDLKTIMAGLACGVPCALAWEKLSLFADNFASIPDRTAAAGMRILGAPAGGDPRVVSGESGAAALGFAAEVLRRREYAPIRERLGIDAASRLLFFSTEGDTDRENYRRIVWDGLYPNVD